MLPNKLEIPVILLIYKRPAHLRQVLNQVALVKPQTLLVIGDGPHPERPEEIPLVEQSRALIKQLPWECHVVTAFSPLHLGLRKRVSSGLTWAFNQVDSGIVLEDDCVPDPSFFFYCQELLHRYEQDQRVMAISGNNFQKRIKRTNYSYYFSRYNHCWGWATWRRAWLQYDDDMVYWPELKENYWLHNIFECDPQAARYWEHIFDQMFNSQIDSWAYRWTYACWLQGGLTALPEVNLVSNIGLGSDATHTKSAKQTRNLRYQPIEFPLRHPPFITRNAPADDFTQKYHFGTHFWMRIKRMGIMLLKRIGLSRN
jgi:hypothetical protein